MVQNSIKVVFGGGSLYDNRFSTPEQVERLLDILQEHGVKVIDTAQLYGPSESLLGKTKAATRFTIDTKHVGGAIPGNSTKEKVIERGYESLKNLQTDSVDVFYIHAPDRNEPLEGTLAGIDQLYKEGKFKRFGLSNFEAHEVEEVVRIATEKGFVLPTVYQGNYNPFARKQETELFPTLRKHKIAFYAYSPSAGGFLTKTSDQLFQGGPAGTGRWDPSTFLGQLYHRLYTKPALLRALDQWHEVAKKEGVSPAELAYRWVAFNSVLDNNLGDALIVGASSEQQLKETLPFFTKGPLSQSAVQEIDGIWQTIKDDAPLDNFSSFLSIQPKAENKSFFK